MTLEAHLHISLIWRKDKKGQTQKHQKFCDNLTTKKGLMQKWKPGRFQQGRKSKVQNQKTHRQIEIQLFRDPKQK